ncbi:MAG: AAA-like domain-containing protein [Gammaproteobacteria bacterium]
MFFDREQETAAFFKLIAKGRNVLMLAPRRVGKTELIYRIGNLAEAQGFRSVIFDMEGYREEKDFFQQLFRGMVWAICCKIIWSEAKKLNGRIENVWRLSRMRCFQQPISLIFC